MSSSAHNNHLKQQHRKIEELKELLKTKCPCPKDVDIDQIFDNTYVKKDENPGKKPEPNTWNPLLQGRLVKKEPSKLYSTTGFSTTSTAEDWYKTKNKTDAWKIIINLQEQATEAPYNKTPYNKILHSIVNIEKEIVTVNWISKTVKPNESQQEEVKKNILKEMGYSDILQAKEKAIRMDKERISAHVAKTVDPSTSESRFTKFIGSFYDRAKKKETEEGFLEQKPNIDPTAFADKSTKGGKRKPKKKTKKSKKKTKRTTRRRNRKSNK